MKLHRKIAKIFGYELIKRNKHPTLSSHIINLINHYKIDLVLDIGANHGQFGNMLRGEGYKGEIHSFEPVSYSFDHLQKASLNDEKWFAHKLAMGAADGKDAINVTEASGMPHYLDALGKYEEYGFVVTGLYPVSREKKSLSVIEMDCVLINSRKA
jgi:FkbM family methyltransferase